MIGTKTKIVMSGGWTNKGVQATEILDESTLRWNTIGDNSTGTVLHALPYPMRSSAFVELDNVGMLVGKHLKMMPLVTSFRYKYFFKHKIEAIVPSPFSKLTN